VITLFGELPPRILSIATGRPSTAVSAQHIWRTPPLRLVTYPSGVPTVEIRLTIRISTVTS
jgi:hypothetical protein